MKRILTFGVASACALMSACELSDPPERVECVQPLRQFSNATGDTLISADGLRGIDIEVGSGPAAVAGNLARVHYTLYLSNTTTALQSSCQTRQTFDLVIGQGGAIRGFEEGLVGMRAGGVRRVIVPPALGYGQQDRPGIPPNSTLVFDLYLVSLH